MTDDLDPSQTAAKTIQFGVGGATYEIDLSEENADAFGEALAQYIGAARRTGGRSSSRSRSPGGTSSGRNTDSATVRAWATEQGIPLSARGRIPADVQQKYDEAH